MKTKLVFEEQFLFFPMRKEENYNFFHNIGQIRYRNFFITILIIIIYNFKKYREISSSNTSYIFSLFDRPVLETITSKLFYICIIFVTFTWVIAFHQLCVLFRLVLFIVFQVFSQPHLTIIEFIRLIGNFTIVV